MAVDSGGPWGKRLEVTQISNTYTTAKILIKFRLNPGVYDLTKSGFCIKLDGTILNNETTYPWRITRNHPTLYGWNKRFDNSKSYSNTNRIMIKVTNLYGATWQPSYGRVRRPDGTYATLNYNAQVRHALVNNEEYYEEVEYTLGVGSSRVNTKNITVSMSYMDGSFEPDWLGRVTIPISTKQIPAPSTPTLTTEYRDYVNGDPTTLRLRATVPSNVEGFFTLAIEDITSGVKTLKSSKGGTNIYVDIPITEAYYDKTWQYRARIYGADIDKRSSTLSVFVEYPVLPIWYYLTSEDKSRLGVSHTRMQVKKAVWYDNNGNAREIKLFAYNNGGSFIT